jgi:hypothetical protein
MRWTKLSFAEPHASWQCQLHDQNGQWSSSCLLPGISESRLPGPGLVSASILHRAIGAPVDFKYPTGTVTALTCQRPARAGASL